MPNMKRTPRKLFLQVTLVLAALFVAGETKAKTLVIPHVLEVSGRISSTPFTFDTTMFITYNGGLGDTVDSGGASVELYLYDDVTGGPMRAPGGEVCNPCAFQVDGEHRKLSVAVDDLIEAKGGFDQSSKTGFGIIVVSGADPDGVAIQGFVVNSHTSAFDLSVFGFEPQPISSAARVFVLPHVLERSGAISSTPYTFDTTLFATYTAGLAGTPSGPGARVDFYLYDQSTGVPMQNNGADVCNPCAFDLNRSTRKQSIRVDDLILAQGAFDQPAKPGFGVIVVGGADPGAVNLSAQVVNSHSGPLDLAVLNLEPQPVRSTLSGGSSTRAFVLPHVLEKSGTINSTQFTFDTTIFATYVGGLAGVTGTGGAILNVSLYDQSGAPMKGLSGKDVCNPCTFELGDGSNGNSARKLSIRMEDLIVNNGGGFDTELKLGYGIVVVGGADPDNVNLQGFVVNSHSGPFDLQMHDPGPYPIGSSGGGGAGGLTSKAFVLPHVLEKSGTINGTQFTFDTTIFANYTAGQGGTPDGPGATLDLYLVDQTGAAPLKNNGADVCNPCSFPLGSSNRKQSIRVDDLITARGAFDASLKLGFGVIVVRGDADSVNLQGFVVNSHTSAFDLAAFGFEPVPLEAELAPGTLPLLSISGLVSGGGVPASGVTVALTGAEHRSLLTDPVGHFAFFVSSNADYIVTPTLTGQTFAPASRSFGPLTSDQTADFTMSPALILSQPVFNGAAVSVSLPTSLGATYTLESKDSLDATGWQPLESVPGDGTIRTLSDTNASPSSRFYRVRKE